MAREPTDRAHPAARGADPQAQTGAKRDDGLGRCSPFALGPPRVSAVLRTRAEDFRVEELLDGTPGGTGAHLWLRVRKRGANTRWVAERLAGRAAVGPEDVGFAGLKDRHALTIQWFSLPLGNRAAPDWSGLAEDGIEVLEAVRHERKLRRGELAGNRFSIMVRRLAGELESLPPRLALIGAHGVPNYFGRQRFGRDGDNLRRAERLFAGEPVRDRHKRGLYLSAARAHLFNLVLGRRVEMGSWAQALEGEAVMLAGSGALVPWIRGDASIPLRTARGEVHPTGPLWGKGPLMSKGECRALEESVLADWGGWRRGLEAAGLRQDRRALRLSVHDLVWRWIGADGLELDFALRAGGFATTVLRELVDYRDAWPAEAADESG